MAGFNPERDPYDPHKVLIRLAADSKIDSPAQAFGLETLDQVLHSYPISEIARARQGKSKRTFVVTFSRPVDVPRLVEALRQDQNVEDASPEFVKGLA